MLLNQNGDIKRHHIPEDRPLRQLGGAVDTAVSYISQDTSQTRPRTAPEAADPALDQTQLWRFNPVSPSGARINLRIIDLESGTLGNPAACGRCKMCAPAIHAQKRLARPDLCKVCPIQSGRVDFGSHNCSLLLKTRHTLNFFGPSGSARHRGDRARRHHHQ